MNKGYKETIQNLKSKTKERKLKIKLTDTDLKNRVRTYRFWRIAGQQYCIVSEATILCVIDGLNKGKCNLLFLVKSRNVSFLVP